MPGENDAGYSRGCLMAIRQIEEAIGLIDGRAGNCSTYLLDARKALVNARNMLRNAILESPIRQEEIRP